jgi:predicted nucleotidyltransferase
MFMNRVQVELPKVKIAEFCQRNHIRKLAVFGSALSRDLGPDSDIDFLVEFDPEHVTGLSRLAGMERELGEIVGRKAELRTAQDLRRYFRKEVVESAEVQYAEG